MTLLQAAQGGGMDFTLIFLMVGIFLVIQFVILGPKQKKREKEMASYIENLPTGSKVITSSGIHGKLIKVEDAIMTVEVDQGVKLRIERGFINFELTKKLNEKSS